MATCPGAHPPQEGSFEATQALAGKPSTCTYALSSSPARSSKRDRLVALVTSWRRGLPRPPWSRGIWHSGASTRARSTKSWRRRSTYGPSFAAMSRRSSTMPLRKCSTTRSSIRKPIDAGLTYAWTREGFPSRSGIEGSEPFTRLPLTWICRMNRRHSSSCSRVRQPPWRELTPENVFSSRPRRRIGSCYGLTGSW